MQYLNFPMRRSVANSIVRAVIKSQKLLESEEVVSQLLQFIKPLLKDQEDYEKCEDVSVRFIYSSNLMKNRKQWLDWLIL